MWIPFRRRSGTERTRGQAMVEFALVLPILAILLVMAIDVGRVYFGWVGLQNVARIGANYAGAHPDGWDPNYPAGGKATILSEYANEMAQDAANLNCSPLPRVSPAATYIPAPSFVDTNGNTRYEMGEQVGVSLNCTFRLITPLANGIFGGGISLNANAIFPVRAGAIAGIPTPSAATPTPSPTATPSATATPSVSVTPTPSATPTATPCQLPIANFVANPTKDKKNQPIQFTDTSQTFGCAVTGWTWDFGDAGTATAQNPSHKYSNDGTYSVRLTVTSPGGTNSVLANGYITICNGC